METKVITHSHLFPNKEEYLAFKAAWSKLAKEKKITSEHILFYNLARGKEPGRGFTPIRSPNKLGNGAVPLQALQSARRRLKYLTTSQYSTKAKNEFVDGFEGALKDEVFKNAVGVL